MALSTAQEGTGNGTETAQARGRKSEARRSADLNDSLPEGIQIGVWKDGRSKPWFVRYGRERRVESFASEQDRNDRAEKLAEARQSHGTTALDGDLSEWRAWQDFRSRVPAPLHELEALWHRFGKRERMPLKAACAKFIDLRFQEKGSGGADAHRHMILHLKRLCDGAGDMSLDALSPNHLRNILNGLINSRTGGDMSLQTKHDHLKNWSNFFERAVLEEWGPKNPCALVNLPAIDAVDKVALKPREVFDLLKHNLNQPVIGRMAFELFGALRASSAARLKPDHVKRSVKGVRLPGAAINEETGETERIHKSGRAQFRQGHPEVLWKWFDHIGEKMWSIRKGSYDEYKRQAFIRAGVSNPGNILRDTCATYLFAATNNLPLVSSLMQHTSLKTTMIYVGMAEEADGKLVLAMTPKAVAFTWEKFVKKFST